MFHKETGLKGGGGEHLYATPAKLPLPPTFHFSARVDHYVDRSSRAFIACIEWRLDAPVAVESKAM